MLRLRLWSENHYAFKPPPCLKRFELPLNEQIFNTIGITTKTSHQLHSANYRHAHDQITPNKKPRIVSYAGLFKPIDSP
ncbi:hypothetical protein RJP56_15515 [Shewanella baltica]|uniref:hypothetical protein n=1 Tax=Shewanella baltica TaxID=62322 RepID=UPI002871E425|nr:hypothetical protein [Shewanella baltica]MDR9767469.1 hypothetical protein [Shewanella baltica]